MTQTKQHRTGLKCTITTQLSTVIKLNTCTFICTFKSLKWTLLSRINNLFSKLRFNYKNKLHNEIYQPCYCRFPTKNIQHQLVAEISSIDFLQIRHEQRLENNSNLKNHVDDQSSIKRWNSSFLKKTSTVIAKSSNYKQADIWSHYKK